MVKIVSNLRAVIIKHRATIEKLKSPEILRPGAFNLFSEISRRIQNEGKDTAGNLILGGLYSDPHSKYRAKRGRQISFVDLTLTGKTLDIDFQCLPAPGGFEIGFINERSGQIMEYLEEMNGAPIITGSPEEIKDSINYINLNISNVIKSDNKRG